LDAHAYHLNINGLSFLYGCSDRMMAILPLLEIVGIPIAGEQDHAGWATTRTD
jgi:hypothetical protein